jgi:hypothetical protein
LFTEPAACSAQGLSLLSSSLPFTSLVHMTSGCPPYVIYLGNTLTEVLEPFLDRVDGPWVVSLTLGWLQDSVPSPCRVRGFMGEVNFWDSHKFSLDFTEVLGLSQGSPLQSFHGTFTSVPLFVTYEGGLLSLEKR